ncbi:YlxR family protein [Lyngbya confervoides]|uniref:YlxR family protein n=1 Tax=Lyngbya confervoides BDU141951 TaxID=1574623 RepID=A0ABD4T1T1_9CYAN|nr:YlxR family protein [Lyngbya confervoides]MCM1982716.1 YlxR family protein [Lyngbya confervoides BDU141951]
MVQVGVRRCISCRRLAHREQFLKVVRLSCSGQVVIGMGMGRSAYLCPTLDCLQVARKKRRLERSLRVTVPPQIYEALENQLQNPPISST